MYVCGTRLVVAREPMKRWLVFFKMTLFSAVCFSIRPNWSRVHVPAIMCRHHINRACDERLLVRGNQRSIYGFLINKMVVFSHALLIQLTLSTSHIGGYHVIYGRVGCLKLRLCLCSIGNARTCEGNGPSCGFGSLFRTQPTSAVHGYLCAVTHQTITGFLANEMHFFLQCVSQATDAHYLQYCYGR